MGGFLYQMAVNVFFACYFNTVMTWFNSYRMLKYVMVEDVVVQRIIKMLGFKYRSKK
ncbi:hypothetical protein TUM17576_36900 [Enterobacter hormaechei]|nr:hypothetical protein TUM17576_36900 [Enterobacter hormaechei]